MREKWARRIALLTGVLMLLLAAMFARLQNPPAPAVEVGDITQPALPRVDDAERQALVALGRKLFETHGCLRCHAVAGQGNPRSPLDGVGARRTAEALRQWIVAPAEMQEQIPAWAFRAKQTYRQLPAEDLAALVAYLQSLQPAATTTAP